MSVVKALKVRFQDITGHKEIIGSLRKLADSGKLPHAFLFTGISGIGKHRTARAFSQYIHCKNRKNGDSCGECPSCLQHQKHNNPDLHFVYPIVKKDGALISKDMIEEWRDMLDNYSYMPSEKWNELLKAGNSQTAIYVNESEEIISRASLSSFQEDYKIFIIWLPEKMRLEAANKLLKIIEEPYEDTIFILVSNNESKILPTILSRTQRFNFKPLSDRELQDLLIENGVDKDVARDAARISEGSLQKADEIACHPEELIEFSDLFKETMRAAYALKAKTLKEISENVAAFGREKIIRFLTYCARMIRENYIYNYSLPPLIMMTADEITFSGRFAPFIHDGNVEQLSQEIARAARDIERNGNSKIVIFDLLLLFSRLVRKPKTMVLPGMEEYLN
ncbi:MAG: DNA polymerase III subunit delta' [Muribaculaceae bacterium]|nr:DNA polymerase III subunit delta' [Muribaculaceae bacterium]